MENQSVDPNGQIVAECIQELNALCFINKDILLTKYYTIIASSYH